MTNLNTIFHVVVSVYQLIEIWNSTQFPAEFPNGQSETESWVKTFENINVEPSRLGETN